MHTPATKDLASAHEVAASSTGRVASSPARGGGRPTSRTWWDGATIGVAAWVSLVLLASAWGAAVLSPRSLILWPPLMGALDPLLQPGLLLALAVGGAAVAFGPSLAARLSWRALLLGSVLAAAAWAVALALAGGTHALISALLPHTDYLSQVQKVGDAPGAFLRTFTGHGLASGVFTPQVRGHPPGFLLLLWSLDRIGLHGARWEAALVIALGASAVPAVLVTLRSLAGEGAARTAAPFLAVAPFAVTLATSADALYLGVGAWGVALFALSTERRGTGGDALALGSGLAFGAGLMLTYGLVPLGAIPLAVAVVRRRIRPLVVAAAGVALVLGAFWLFGFSWFAGLGRSRGIYARGVSTFRPYDYFLVANLAAFAVIVGPATAAALGRLRDRRVWLLVGAALVAIAAADASGLSKAEVERIWLPFAPWMVAACAAFPGRGADDRDGGTGRGWLAMNAVTAVAFQVLIRSPW